MVEELFYATSHVRALTFTQTYIRFYVKRIFVFYTRVCMFDRVYLVLIFSQRQLKNYNFVFSIRVFRGEVGLLSLHIARV